MEEGRTTTNFGDIHLNLGAHLYCYSAKHRKGSGFCSSLPRRRPRCALGTTTSGRKHHYQKALDSLETMFSSYSTETRKKQWEHHCKDGHNQGLMGPLTTEENTGALQILPQETE